MWGKQDWAGRASDCDDRLNKSLPTQQAALGQRSEECCVGQTWLDPGNPSLYSIGWGLPGENLALAQMCHRLRRHCSSKLLVNCLP